MVRAVHNGLRPTRPSRGELNSTVSLADLERVQSTFRIHKIPKNDDMTRGVIHPPFDPASRLAAVDSDQWIGAKQFEWSGLAGGCLMSLGSAVVTCCLLVLNGALVMGILAAMAATGVDWVKNNSANQFALFAGPICLAIIQWFMIDTLRGILRRQLRRRSEATDPMN